MPKKLSDDSSPDTSPHPSPHPSPKSGKRILKPTGKGGSGEPLRDNVMMFAGIDPRSNVTVESNDFGTEVSMSKVSASDQTSFDISPAIDRKDQTLFEGSVSDNALSPDEYKKLKRKGFTEAEMVQDHKDSPADPQMVVTMAGEPKSPKVNQFLTKIFDKVALFEGMGFSHYEKLVKEIGFLRVKAKTVVIRQGDVGDRFYIIEKGKFRITVSGPDGKGAKKVCRSFKRGQCFGELALMYNTPRACSITAKMDGELWVLDRFAFRRILTNVTKVKLERNLKFLGKIPIFASSSEEEYVKLATAFTERRFASESCICKQGDVGDCLYIILEGTCKVQMYDKETNTTIELNRLNAGDYFGEQALINGTNRNADVVSVGKVVALRLDKDLFELLLGKKDAVKQHMHRRMRTYDKQAEQGVVQAKRHSLGNLHQENLIGLDGALDKSERETEKSKSTNEASESFVKNRLSHLDSRDHSAQIVVVQPSYQLMMDQGLMGDRITFKNHDEIQMDDLTRLAVLGNGSFGTVFLVENELTGEQFALKQVTKRRVLEADVQENIEAEIEMMSELHHDFIIRLHRTFEDQEAYWLLEDLALGGELQRQLLQRKRFNNDAARFYVASVILAFEHMHSLNIVYRDLKPENILLNNQGYARLTDLGFAKKIPDGRTYTYCGTPCYLAPEMIKGEPYGKGVDWWTLGVFTYELLCGKSPFKRIKPNYDDPGCSLSYSIVNHPVTFPEPDQVPLTDEAKDFIRQLLQKDPNRRLGVIHGGCERIKKHEWFTGLDWKQLLEQAIKPPIIPFVDDNTIRSARRNFGIQQGRSSVVAEMAANDASSPKNLLGGALEKSGFM